MVDTVIQLNTGVSKKILKAGEGGPKPQTGENVKVNYEGRLESGKVFDSSYDREPFETKIGVGQVIQGWDIGIMSMSIGEKAELTITGEFAYGQRGSPPTIPPNATLIFTVELLGIEDREPAGMSDSELFDAAKSLKEAGNSKFKAGDLKGAESQWREGFNLLEKCKEEYKEIIDLAVILLQNIAVVSNKLGNFNSAIESCTKALEYDANAVKALFQRSVAHLQAKNFDQAAADCKAAVNLNPKEKSYRDHWELIKTEKTAALKSEQEAMKAFFASGVYNEKKVTITPSKKNFDKLPKFNPNNPQVFFDLAIGNEGEEDYVKERVVFELFSDVPKSCENFRALCTGEKEGEGLHYKGNKFHRVIKGFMMQGGDTTNGDGTGGNSIYGRKFDDEGIWYPHTHKGILSMANAGPNTNGSQFFICYGPTPHLNNKHIVYGRVIDNYEICEKVEKNKTAPGDKPIKPVQIVDCGELLGESKKQEQDCNFLSNYSD